MFYSLSTPIRRIRASKLFFCVLFLFAWGICLASQVGRAQTVNPHKENDANMNIALVDSFIVPEANRDAFLQRVHQSAEILKSLPGFLEGHIYVKKAGDSELNVVTTALWKDEEAFKNAGVVMAGEYRKQGKAPTEIMKELGVRVSRGVYSRTAY